MQPSVSCTPSCVLIGDEVWNERIQDYGKKYEKLVKTTYNWNKIVSVEYSDDDRLFYFDLTAIAVDLCRMMKEANASIKGWSRLPKSNTKIKEKIVERLLAL